MCIVDCYQRFNKYTCAFLYRWIVMFIHWALFGYARIQNILCMHFQYILHVFKNHYTNMYEFKKKDMQRQSELISKK